MDVMEAAQVDAIQTQADYKNWKPALTAIEQELRRAIEFGFNKEELAEARSNITAAAENAIKSWPTVKSEDVASAIAQSAAHGQPTRATGSTDSVMAGLACGEVSPLAWRFLQPAVDLFMTISDAEAEQAMREVGVTPKIKPIRGGTDGSRLSFMGLPCPNLFTGGHNFHGKHEYIPVPSMEKAVETLIAIARLTVTQTSSN